MAATTTPLAVTPTSGRIGASVDVDLDRLLDDPTLQDALRDALHEHLVLVLPRADPTPAQHEAIGRLFGELQPVEEYNVAHPESRFITVFDSDGGYRADRWHCDASWREAVPKGASLCLRVCPTVGGDTVFANTNAAYEALSTGMKRLLDGRRALHEIGPGSCHEHPVVVAHPITGRPVLFVNDIFTRRITNLPDEESEAVLPFLLRHVGRPEFTYRHRWQEGDLVLWDNWGTQHYALFDYDERRVNDRVAFVGRPLEAYRLDT